MKYSDVDDLQSREELVVSHGGEKRGSASFANQVWSVPRGGGASHGPESDEVILYHR
jgi:hypothetical protein